MIKYPLTELLGFEKCKYLKISHQFFLKKISIPGIEKKR